ncbi:MAG: hypothetical protein ABI678_18410 [Kofleriaceae bacterium]
MPHDPIDVAIQAHQHAPHVQVPTEGLVERFVEEERFVGRGTDPLENVFDRHSHLLQPWVTLPAVHCSYMSAIPLN